MFRIILLLVALAVASAASFNATELLKDPKGFTAGFLDWELEGEKKAVLKPNVASSSTLGVDISQALSSSTASCIVGEGYGSILVPRGYTSTGHVDSNMCSSIQAGISGGFSHVHTYLFPCPTCGDAAGQVNTLASALSSCSGFNGRIWIDVEGTQYWLGDYTKNQQFYQQLVDACNASKYSCGVYSSANNWNTLFGSTSYTYGSNLPAWYAHYDNDPSFNDWASHSFGGFKPWGKQYAGDTTLCGFGVDKNYVPSP